MNHSDASRMRTGSRKGRALGVLALALASQAGCGREFYREWANQDVSEAVYEKSRDPRWRLDLFSVEPPALARFSDPYDPDRPPAPPDDRATEAMAPVPQWPDNRLLVPPEGTGYLDMLDGWLRDRPAPAARRPGRGRGAPAPAGGPPPTQTVPPPGPPPSGSSSPFNAPADAPAGAEAPGNPPAGANSGAGDRELTPIPVPDARPTPPAGVAPGAGAPEASRPRVKTRPRDAGVVVTAFQETGLPMPVPTPAPEAPAPRTPSRDIQPPPIGGDPSPEVRGSDLSAPVNPRTGQTPDEFRAGEAMASELAGILVPSAITFDEAEAAGLPRGSNPYILSMDQAFTLALINSRVYQFQLEQVYGASLAVTLQRFAFTPQFYAGLTPTTPVATGGGPGPAIGFPPPVVSNSFTYATRETGAQVSNLNVGTMAGFGKVFSTGGRLVAGFANQLVFNFVGKNSFQPSVKSFLPLSLVQPFLRGGGRAVTLEALTQAERSLVYAVRAYAKFRQEFTVATLIGGTVQNFGSAVPSLGFTGGGNSDPTIGFINVLEDIQIIENDRRNIAAYEQLVTVYKELIKGESSGLSQLQLDQVDSGLQGARQQYVADRTLYRSDLDSFKMQMGLPPDTPIIPDRSLTRAFKEVYDDVDDWQRDPRRNLDDLPGIAARLPVLQDVVVDGRSILGVYPPDGANNEDPLEDVLLAAERVAMEHRLDLMNVRAALYDSWRQIKVTANALQGVLNVSLTNQFVTPPNNTNPFGFVDQAKQFSLAINAELPLVRMAERNAFRTALINYQRQRRALMNTEDSIKLIIRQDIRAMQTQALNYQIAKRLLVLTIRQKDQAFEQIIAPPQGAAGGGASQAPLQTSNLISFQQQLLRIENQLVTNWYAFQSARLQLYRDLGTLPIDEWEAFHELFPAEPLGSGPHTAARDARPARAEAALADRRAEAVGR